MIYILSVYSQFSDRVGLPLHNTPFPGVLMKSIYIVDIKNLWIISIHVYNQDETKYYVIRKYTGYTKYATF